MTLAGGTVRLAEFRAQRGDFLDGHRREVIAPGPEYVRDRRGEVFVRQVTETGHHAVVLDAINRDRAGQTEQGSRQYFLAIALQEIGFRQRRKRASEANAGWLVARGAVGEINGFAFRHQLVSTRNSDFGRVDCCVIARRSGFVSLLRASPNCEPCEEDNK